MKRIEAVNDFVVKFANVNGSGSASANELFARSFLRMGVPVSPKRKALGRAARICIPKSPSWVRWASSTRTMMLSRSLSTPPASANLKMVVMMILRVSWRKSWASSSRDSALIRLGMSEAWKVALIWASRSSRSTTISTAGLRRAGWRRSFWAAKTISSDLPDP